KIWAAFLSGYLDADGYVTRNQLSIGFGSASLELLKGCQELFSRLGINACLNKDFVGNKHKLTISGRQQLAKVNEHLSPYIRLSRKRQLLNKCAERKGYNFRAHESDRVASIVNIGKQETISIEVDDIHTHVTNGLISHNTKHGLNVHGVVFDELHAQPNRALY